ncbi:hypothetical protein DFJ73DRAFT_955730 [Zopfochytrium polystomum]|nr:hypothetical protein DFJ73DRAFT_955730 [Zopfochytrium polystomum]
MARIKSLAQGGIWLQGTAGTGSFALRLRRVSAALASSREEWEGRLGRQEEESAMTLRAATTEAEGIRAILTERNAELAWRQTVAPISFPTRTRQEQRKQPAYLAETGGDHASDCSTVTAKTPGYERNQCNLVVCSSAHNKQTLPEREEKGEREERDRESETRQCPRKARNSKPYARSQKDKPQKSKIVAPRTAARAARTHKQSSH